MKRKSFIVVFVLIITLSLVRSVSAQSYLFRIDEEIVHAYWNEDGTLALDYTLVFYRNHGTRFCCGINERILIKRFDRGIMYMIYSDALQIYMLLRFPNDLSRKACSNDRYIRTLVQYLRPIWIKFIVIIKYFRYLFSN